jgi:hypothetical protein
MKKILLLPIILLCISCTKDSLYSPQENITFSIDYSFPTKSGNITAKSSSSYIEFYDEFIITKILTPRTYELSFRNTTTNEIISVARSWSVTNPISLPEGTYNVTGKSWPKDPTVYVDTCHLSFQESVTIDANTSNVILTAKYDCYLILIEPSNIKSVELRRSSGPDDPIKDRFLPLRSGKYYHLFGLHETFIDSSTLGKISGLMVDKTNGDHFNLDLFNKTWSRGKYYYFKSVSDEYFLAPMTSNN